MTNQRPFKFRAWSEADSRFLQNEEITNTLLVCHGEATKQQPLANLLLLNIDIGFKFQQWTGLLDKTGREIYEGDICRYKWDRHNHDIEESTGEVFFDEGVFFFGRKDLFCSVDLNFRVDSLEVIGNVFENPELLNNHA